MRTISSVLIFFTFFIISVNASQRNRIHQQSQYAYINSLQKQGRERDRNLKLAQKPKRKVDLNDPFVQATIQNFGRLKGFKKDISIKKFCYQACNRHSLDPCTIFFAERSEDEQKYIDKEDLHNFNKLKPLSYIKSNHREER